MPNGSRWQGPPAASTHVRAMGSVMLSGAPHRVPGRQPRGMASLMDEAAIGTDPGGLTSPL